MARRAQNNKSVRRRKMAQRRGSKTAAEWSKPDAHAGPMRLNRFLAKAGVASRRESDEIIAAGRVSINGVVVKELGVKVGDEDEVMVDGKSVSPKAPVYILLNKPKNCITTKDDEKGRQTVMDVVSLPENESGSVFPVGRLDRDTTGLLLLTNDGDLAHRLMHPSYNVEKLYVISTADTVKSDQLEMLRDGVELDDGVAKADHIAFVGEDHRKVALQIHEGRNRQVRRMFEALGHSVKHLDRTHYAGLTLKGVRTGKWRRLRNSEINSLRRKVKLKPIVFAK